MTIERLFSFALAVQILLAFFGPPVGVGERLLFPSDLWVFLWVGVFSVVFLRNARAWERKEFLVQATASGAVLAIVFLRGYGRPSLAEGFLPFFTSAPRDDFFSFGREAVISGRFWVWIVGGMLSARLAANRSIVDRTLFASVLISVASLVAVKFSLGIRSELGVIYRYDPNVIQWTDRAYGVFRSPIEASVTLCLALLILVQSPTLGRATRSGILAVIVLGVVLSKTLTAFISAVVALAFAVIAREKPKYARMALGISAVSAAAILALVWNRPFFAQKQETLLFRVKPWGVYWNSAKSRIDLLLFGNGFHPHFSDDIYVFIFSRGGLFLLAAAGFAFWRWWKKEGCALSPIQKTIPLYFLISGLTVDSLIIRPVAYVLICAGILTLKPERN